MKLTHAMLVAGILISVSGSIALLTSAFFAGSASGAAGEVAVWDGNGLWVAPGSINRTDLPAGDADGAALAGADQTIAVVLARMLHRSDADKTAGD